MSYPTKIPVALHGAGTYSYLGRDRDTQGRLVHVRGLVQDIDPIIRRKEYLTAINEASVRRNPDAPRYIGSIPQSILLDWLQKRGRRIDQFARNEDGIKDQFKRWFLSSDYAKLHNASHKPIETRQFGGSR